MDTQHARSEPAREERVISLSYQAILKVHETCRELRRFDERI